MKVQRMIGTVFPIWRDFANPLDIALTGPLIGLVAVAAIGLGATLAWQLPGADRELARLDTRPTARIPRPRPDEPLTTASLAPSRTRPSGAPAIRRVPVQPVEAGGLGLEILRSKAFLLASASPDCDRVVSSETLESRDRPDAGTVFRIRCENGARFHLGREELEAETPPQQRAEPVSAVSASSVQDAALSEQEVVRACEDKVRGGLAVPRSLDRLPPSTDVHQTFGGAALVTFDFNALNGFGFPLTLRAQCVFDQSRIARLEVQPR
jgi:hypothetical protein